VQIATKLNRSHVVHGKAAYILPCLGRIEIDRQGGGEQAVSVEDRPAACTARAAWPRRRKRRCCRNRPSSPASRKAMLDPNPKVDWDAWVADYSKIRDAIAETYPEIFHDFNARMWTPGGFRKPNGAASASGRPRTARPTSRCRTAWRSTRT
jgi:hypothetical protein